MKIDEKAVLIPFCTHSGGGIGENVNNVKKICTKADIINARSISGSSVKCQRKRIEDWIQDNLV